MPATASRKFISDFGPTERFEGVFTIANAQLGTTRAGKPYLRALLSDKSGQLPARMWSISEEIFRKLPTDGFVFAEGDTQPFQGELQLIVQPLLLLLAFAAFRILPLRRSKAARRCR